MKISLKNTKYKKSYKTFSPKFFVEVFISISRTRRDCPKEALRVIPGRAKRVQGGFFQPPPKIWVFLGFLDHFLGGRQPNTPFSLGGSGWGWKTTLSHPIKPPVIRIIALQGYIYIYIYIYFHKVALVVSYKEE